MKIINKIACLLFLYPAYFTATAQTSSLPTFPIVYRGHIYLEAEADNHKGNFLFDTGADNVYYDSTYYASQPFDYREFAKARLPGAGTTPQTVRVVMDSVDLSFGNHTYRTSIVPILQLKPIVGDFADGIIGMEYFRQFAMGIDYRNETITLYPSINEADVSAYSKVAMQQADGRLFVPLTLKLRDGIRISGDFLLDFGSGGSLILTGDIANRYNLRESIEPKVPFYTKYGGIGGESSSYTFRADSIYFGQYAFEQAVMDFSIDQSGALSSDKYPGLIGNGILERFDIVIDFQNHILYLKPNEYYSDRFTSSRLGFSFVNRNQTRKAWIVTGFYKDTPAEKSGLQIDDHIIAINGTNVTEISYEEEGLFFKDLDEVEVTVLRKDKIVKMSFPLLPIL